MGDAIYCNTVLVFPGHLVGTLEALLLTLKLIFLNHVITADLPLHEISNGNVLPNGCAKAAATKKGAKKLSDESHDFIIEKIFREGKHKKISIIVIAQVTKKRLQQVIKRELEAVVLVTAAAIQVIVNNLIFLLFCELIHFVSKHWQ